VPAWFSADATILTAFTLVLLFLIRPINELLYALPVIRQASVSLKKIEQLEGELRRDQAPQSDIDPFFSNEPLTLELKGVCHRYPGDTDDRHFMLGPIDLLIKEGEVIFIVGGNGSGKTTLAMLLSGMYEPEQGAIRLNGKRVNQDNVDRYRQYFSAVFSDFHLFEQLLDSDHEELHEKAMHYVEKFAMAHKVKVVDGKFSTLNLSTGQRKRLALVSSYLEDRPIYLFDEWAADQDPAFKRVFYTELLPELRARGKTVLVITHDDAYFPAADRIVKLEDGRLRSIDGHHENGDRQHLANGAY
jgi:putative ATP-binding cassette transporter